MIDFHRLFAELVQTMQSVDFPNANTIVKKLDLNVRAARISKTKSGLLTIYGANLRESAAEIDVIAALTPRQALNLLFSNSQIPYDDVRDEIFGPDQRIQQSQRSEGFAILFQADGLACGLTASGPNGVVECLFCEARGLTLAG